MQGVGQSSKNDENELHITATETHNRYKKNPKTRFEDKSRSCG